jgi:hypothetical protein
MLSHTLDPASNVKDALNCRVLVEFSHASWLLKISHRGDAKFHCCFVVNLIFIGDFRDKKGLPWYAYGFKIQHVKRC